MGIALIVLFLVLVGPGRACLGRRLENRRARAQAAGLLNVFGRTPMAVRQAVRGRDQIVIRRARDDDHGAVALLAGLTEQPAPPAPLVLAEADGMLVAAVSTSTGAVVSDPFVATHDVVALLRLRAAQLDRAA